MKTLHYILLVILFVAGFLFGVQIPNFIDQYEKRIDAHFLEASESFKGFQEIADRFHSGSMEALIEKHEASGDSTFNAEAQPLRKIFERKIRFEREHQALQASLLGKVRHVVMAGDQEIIQETWHSYSVNLPLNTTSILSGLSIALVLIVLLELIIVLGKRIFRTGADVEQPV